MSLAAATVLVADATIGLAVATLTGVVTSAAFGARQRKDDRRRLAATEDLLALAKAADHARRTPRLEAVLTARGGMDLLLHVWLHSAEPLESLWVEIVEGHDKDCPVGFLVGQEGVSPEPHLADPDALPTWKADVTRREAAWRRQISPGCAATWQVVLRQTADVSGGSEAVRLAASCRAEGDGVGWEMPVPVEVTDEAAKLIRGTPRIRSFQI